MITVLEGKCDLEGACAWILLSTHPGHPPYNRGCLRNFQRKWRQKKKWGRREFYKMLIEMSSVAFQKENENAVTSSGQMPNALVKRWMGELHRKLGAEFPVSH